MTKKVSLRMIAIALFAGTVAFGVSINLSNNVNLTDLTLSNIHVLAQNEDGNSNCQGGSCGFTWNDGNSCNACCPVGKNPKCTPSDGCSCS